MSALLGHIKSHRAMAAALDRQSELAASPHAADLLARLSAAHNAAAAELEAVARAECSGGTASSG